MHQTQRSIEHSEAPHAAKNLSSLPDSSEPSLSTFFKKIQSVRCQSVWSLGALGAFWVQLVNLCLLVLIACVRGVWYLVSKNEPIFLTLLVFARQRAINT